MQADRKGGAPRPRCGRYRRKRAVVHGSAVKVAALSCGVGFVIVPLVQSDAVNHYHRMSAARFVNAVALGSRWAPGAG